jgi:O-acetyl-ADP-ribose deacetylase (regulator of RNase III)
MAKTDLVNRLGKTNVYVSQGDITQFPADAIVTSINSDGLWYGGIDGAIQRVAGNQYHNQASAQMPLHNLQTVIARGNRKTHKGQFDNVIFVIDDSKSPLQKVVYTGLETANNKGYRSILLPTIRMGVALGTVEKTPEEAIQRMGKGVEDFVKAHSTKIGLREVRFVVYNDPSIAKKLSDGLSKLKSK